MDEELAPEELHEIVKEIMEACSGLDYSQIQMITAYKMLANTIEQSMCAKIMMMNMQKLLQ